MSDDGRTIAITGVCTDTDTNEYYSRIMVFEEINDAFVLKGGKIDNSFRTTSFVEDSYAHVSLSGDGNMVAVATVYVKNRSDPTLSNREGSVVVYEFDGVDWAVFSTEYSGDPGTINDSKHSRLVSSLNSDGSMIAIGIPCFDGAGDNSSDQQNIGAVLVCNVGDSASCLTVATGNSANDYVGSSVMISGSGQPCVVFGSFGSDTSNGVDSGSASVYCDKIGPSWEFIPRGATLVGEAANDEFGSSVAISSDSAFIAVGASRNDRDALSNDNGGHVRVYKFDINTNKYVQIGSDIDGERGSKQEDGLYYEGDLSGYSLALSDQRADGLLRVAIGAPNNDGGGGYYNGHVRLYECNPDITPVQWVKVLDDIDGQVYKESAGRSVAMSQDGTRIIFGSPEYGLEYNGYYEGSAVVYEQTEYSSAPSSSLYPSLSPTFTEKTIVSTGMETIIYGVRQITSSEIEAFRNTTETNLFFAISSVNSDVSSVEVIIFSINGEPYNAGGRRLLWYNSFIGRSRRTESYVIIKFTVNVKARVEAVDIPINTDYDETISGVLGSEGVLDDIYSSINATNPDANVTLVESGPLINSFQIRTNLEEFDFSGNTTWCLGADSVALDSLINVRRCDSLNRRQVWSKDAYDQVKLAAFNEPKCMVSQSRLIFVGTCNQIVDDFSTRESEKSFTFENDIDGIKIKQARSTGVLFVGLEPTRKYMRIKLYKNQVPNDSLNKWEIVDGKFSSLTQTWNPN